MTPLLEFMFLLINSLFGYVVALIMLYHFDRLERRVRQLEKSAMQRTDCGGVDTEGEVQSVTDDKRAGDSGQHGPIAPTCNGNPAHDCAYDVPKREWADARLVYSLAGNSE